MGHWKAVGRGREALRKEVGHLVRPEALARKVLAPPEALVPQGAPVPPGAPNIPKIFLNRNRNFA